MDERGNHPASIDGVGTDIVSVARIAALMSQEGSRFAERWFSPDEVTYCSAQAHPERHLAARLAAKEAVAKALRLDSAGPVPWRGIEVIRDERGAPAIRLADNVRQGLPGVADHDIRISLAHCDEFATAVAVVSSPVPSTPVSGAPTGKNVGRFEPHPDPVTQALREYDALRDPGADPQLEAVKAAILLEDLAGIVLSDDQIDPSVLADAASMEALINGTRGGL
ncbi:MAG: holo-ACP synthase [Propionicimonas sp.]